MGTFDANRDLSGAKAAAEPPSKRERDAVDDQPDVGGVVSEDKDARFSGEEVRL